MMDVSLDRPAPRPLIATTFVLRAAVVAALLAMVAAAGPASSGDNLAVSRAIIEQTNAARADAGLPPLSIDPRLTRAADAYARARKA